MNEQVKLTAGVLGCNGMLYILFETSECDEGEVVLARAERTGDRLILHPLAEPEEIVSLISLSESWGEVACVAALEADGNLLFAMENSVVYDHITGAGFNRADSAGLGRMTTLKQVKNSVFALGYGGQIYRRTPHANWQELHVPREGVNFDGSPCLYTLIETRDGLYFGGTLIREFRESSEISAASDAGDGALLAELILNAVQPDLMALLHYDGNWSNIGFDYHGLVVEIFPAQDGGWFIFSSIGVLWHTPDFQEFDERIVLEKNEKFFDIKSENQEIFVLISQNLYVFSGEELLPFSPALPSLSTGYTNISVHNGNLAAIHENGVFLLEGGSWQSLTPELIN